MTSVGSQLSAVSVHTANPLVVFLLVGAYKLVRDGSRQILSRAGAAYSPVT
jgi:hypothetical protein